MASNQFYAPLRNLQRPVHAQPGGICHIWFALVEDIYQIPEVTPGTAIIDSDDILLQGVECWYELNSQPKRGYRHEQKAGDGGPYLETTLTATIPFDSPVNHLTLDHLKYHKVIAIAERPDGTKRLIGSLDNPARIVHTTDTGESARDLPGTVVTITWISEDAPPIYSGTVSPISPF